MRFFILVILCCLCIFSYPNIGQTEANVSPSAENAILMEAETGRILFAKKAHEQKPVASITKIMTALVAIEHGQLTDDVKVSKRAVETNGSSIYLQLNERMSLEDLLYGLMLRSGNDASVAIAEHVGGSVEGFVFLMNQTAASLGMTDTHFTNPHGLDEEGHYSTAYDMALLMRYAKNNERFSAISGTSSHQAKMRDYPWHNKNKLLTRLYEPCTGGKTGFTTKAGRTLVTTAQKNQLSLIAVTLNASDDWNDHMQLYEWGFEHFLLKRLESKGLRSFKTADQQMVGYINEDVLYPLQQSEYRDVRKQFVFNDSASHQQEQIGTIRYFFQADLVKEIPVYNKNKSDWFMNMKQILFELIQVDDHG